MERRVKENGTYPQWASLALQEGAARSCPLTSLPASFCFMA